MVKFKLKPKTKKTLEDYRVIQGDCISMMSSKKGLLSSGYNFIFADPPFNIGQKYNDYRDKIAAGEYREFTRTWMFEAWRNCSPNGGILVIHGPDALAELCLEFAREHEMPRIAWVNWMYNFGQCTRAQWVDARCHCLIFANGTYTWNPDDVLIESARVRYGDKRVNETERGGRRVPGTVWGTPDDGPFWGRVNGNSQERRKDHPNQLPERYLERLIRAYTNPGDRILDPFGGSGTTIVVAKALQRKCDTIEISEASVASIKERLSKGAVRL